MLLLINYSPVLKAPHSLRQINDVLIIVAVCGAPLGSANVRVGRNCASVFFAARTQAMRRQRRVAWFGHVEVRRCRSLGTAKLLKGVRNFFFFISISGASLVCLHGAALSNRSLSAPPVLSSQISIIPANRPKIKI